MWPIPSSRRTRPLVEAEDATLEDEALVEAESDADEDDEEADESEDSLTLF